MDALQKDSMKNEYTKTDRIILLIQTICRSPRLSLSESKVKEILGDPSRAQWYKLKLELLEDNGPRKSILLERTDEKGNTIEDKALDRWIEGIAMDEKQPIFID